jgi:hypothetical protein
MNGGASGEGENWFFSLMTPLAAVLFLVKVPDEYGHMTK